MDTNPNRIKGQYTDVSLVEKFELTEEEYSKRTDTVRAFKERNKLGRFSEEAARQRAALEAENEKAAANIKVGDRCQVGDDTGVTRRGYVRYIGKFFIHLGREGSEC